MPRCPTERVIYLPLTEFHLLRDTLHVYIVGYYDVKRVLPELAIVNSIMYTGDTDYMITDVMHGKHDNENVIKEVPKDRSAIKKRVTIHCTASSLLFIDYDHS